MIDPTLTVIPPGAVDVTAPVFVDALAAVDPTDPALPNYRVIANNRQPVALRDLMIMPVRTGYLGIDGHRPDPALVPPTGAEAVPGIAVTDVFVPVPDGVARAQVYRPEGDERPRPVVLYLHGGGFTVGSSEDTDYITRRLARDLDAVVLSANYRLAPEFQFPVPLDDVTAVYRWLLTDSARIGGDGGPVVVAGDSAGSNFAAALPVRARDEGLAAPAAVVLLGAFTDFRAERWASFQDQAPRGIVYDSAFFGFIRGAYLGATDWAHPWASPIEADLSGYPPTVIATGTHDPIIDSARAFAAALERAGTTVAAYWPDGMPHGFYFFPGVHAEEDVAFALVRDRIGAVLAARVSGQV